MDGPFGRFDSVKRRYYLWVEAGVLEDVFKALRTHADQEWLMMDATIVRALARHTVARAFKSPQFLDVETDQVARGFAFIAAHLFGRVKIAQA